MQGQTPSVKVWDAAGRFRAGVLICIVVVVLVESEPAQKAWQVMFLSKTSIYKKYICGFEAMQGKGGMYYDVLAILMPLAETAGEHCRCCFFDGFYLQRAVT